MNNGVQESGRTADRGKALDGRGIRECLFGATGRMQWRYRRGGEGRGLCEIAGKRDTSSVTRKKKLCDCVTGETHGH